jgi:hypothetical protein
MAKKAIEDYQIIEITAFTAAKDFDAVISSHGWLVDDKNSGDLAVREIAELKDLLEDWNCVYDDTPHVQRLDACNDLYTRIQEIERKGLMAQFGLSRTDDGFSVAVIIFVKAEPERQVPTQAVVARNFRRMMAG